MLRSERVGGFIASPSRPTRRDLDNRSVRIPDVEAREIVPVERTVYRNSEIDQPTFPHEQAIIVCDMQCKMMGAPDSGCATGRIRPFEESDQ